MVGMDVSGYELHLGITERDGCPPFADLVRSTTGERVADGAVSADGLVVGTYVHGLFGGSRVREALLGALARRRGIAFAPTALPADPYAAVARWFAASVDVDGFLAAVGLASRG